MLTLFSGPRGLLCTRKGTDSPSAAKPRAGGRSGSPALGLGTIDESQTACFMCALSPVSNPTHPGLSLPPASVSVSDIRETAACFPRVCGGGAQASCMDHVGRSALPPLLRGPSPLSLPQGSHHRGLLVWGCLQKQREQEPCKWQSF